MQFFFYFRWLLGQSCRYLKTLGVPRALISGKCESLEKYNSLSALHDARRENRITWQLLLVAP